MRPSVHLYSPVSSHYSSETNDTQQPQSPSFISTPASTTTTTRQQSLFSRYSCQLFSSRQRSPILMVHLSLTEEWSKEQCSLRSGRTSFLAYLSLWRERYPGKFFFLYNSWFSQAFRLIQLIEVRDLSNSVARAIKPPVQTNEITLLFDGHRQAWHIWIFFFSPRADSDTAWLVGKGFSAGVGRICTSY